MKKFCQKQSLRATERSSGKKLLLKSRQNPWKTSVKGFIFSKITGYKPVTSLTVNPFTWIFQGFCLDFKSFAVVFKIFHNTYFPEHFSIAVSVCVKAILSKLLRLLFKDVLLINHNRRQHTNQKILHCSMYIFSWELATLLKLARLQFTFVLLKVIMLKWKLFFLQKWSQKLLFLEKKS